MRLILKYGFAAPVLVFRLAATLENEGTLPMSGERYLARPMNP